MKNFSSKLILILMTAVCSMTSLPVMAQDSTPPLAEEWLFTPKSDHLMEFRKALGEHVEVRQKHDDPWDWEVFSAYAGDNFGQYAIRYCCTNWAELDAYEKWNAENPEVREHWATEVMPHIEKTQHYYNFMDWSNSHWGDDAAPFRYVTVDEWTIKGGHEAKMTEARNQMSQIALNQGWSAAGHNWIWFTEVGGASKVAIAIPHKNFASMAGTGESFGEFLGEHMGSQEAAAELMSQFASSTLTSSTTIWQHHPEFSTSGDD